MSAVTVEHVHWAYQTFLNREPESQSVIAAHLNAPDLTHLARCFIESEEFLSTLPPPAPVPLDAQPNEVDVDVDAATLELLIHHVRRCWELLGNQRAHHSVITDPAFLPESFAENESEFWASGATDANVLLSILARHGVTSLAALTCVELGCGVGRVTRPLTEHFATVHAYDISAPHLEIARTRCKAKFHLLRTLPAELAPADVFYSRIVLQHNPPPIIAMLVRNALDCLRPGGIAVFQVPTYEIGYSFKIGEYIERIGKVASDMEMHCLPQHHVFRIAAEAGCRLLEVREEDSTGRGSRDVSNMFVIQRQ